MIERVPLDADGHVDLHQALRALSVRGITRVFSEGGPSVAARLIALELADEVALITADKPLGRPGVPALDLKPVRRLPTDHAIVRLSLSITARTGCGYGGERADRATGGTRVNRCVTNALSKEKAPSKVLRENMRRKVRGNERNKFIALTLAGALAVWGMAAPTPAPR